MSSLVEFQILKKIGDGSYSTVYHVRRISDQIEYALKKVKLKNLSEKELKNSINEVRILASIHDENVISYKNAFFDKLSQCLCIVMEYANDGDLLTKINEHTKKNSNFTEDQVWKIVIQVVKGLNKLHNLNILHRDMKSANVFLNRDLTAKLGDLNVSKITQKGLGYTQTGTPYYASPEVWKDQPYDKKSDIWSLGCVIYEMITLKPPFRARDMKELFQTVLSGNYDDIPLNYSKDLAKLIRSMLNVPSFLRPSCEQILEKDYIKEKAEQLNIKLMNNEEIKDVLMQTIQIPNNFFKLSEKLPKPNYSTENSPVPNIRIKVPDGRICNINSKLLQLISENKDNNDYQLPNIKKPSKLFEIPSKSHKNISSKSIEKLGSNVIKGLAKNKSIVASLNKKISPQKPTGLYPYQENINDKVSNHNIFVGNIESARMKKNQLYNKYIRELLNEKIAQREKEIDLININRKEVRKVSNPYLKNNLIQFMEYDKNNQKDYQKKRAIIDKLPKKLQINYPKKRASN